MKWHRALQWHLLQSSFHKRVAQVKVNISGHFPSLQTVSMYPAVILRFTPAPAQTCLLLPPWCLIFYLGGGGEGLEGGALVLEIKGKKMPAHLLGIWLPRSCCCLPWKIIKVTGVLKCKCVSSVTALSTFPGLYKENKVTCMMHQGDLLWGTVSLCLQFWELHCGAVYNKACGQSQMALCHQWHEYLWMTHEQRQTNTLYDFSIRSCHIRDFEEACSMACLPFKWNIVHLIFYFYFWATASYGNLTLEQL